MATIINNEYVIENENAGGGGSEFVPSGTYPELTAGNITPKATEPSRITQKFAIQTTGGDMDLQSVPAKLYKIKGNLDEQLNPFYAVKLVSTGMNLYDGTNDFPVVKGSWGEYGTTQANNGYIVIGDVSSVLFSVDKSDWDDCQYVTYNGKNYYLPPHDGYLRIVSSDGSVQSVHLAWSNSKDDETGTFGNSEYQINQFVEEVHQWGLAGIVGVNRSTFDEIDFEQAKSYRRIDRVKPSVSDWTMTTETSDDEIPVTTYTFTYVNNSFKPNGLWKCLFGELESIGNSFVYKSTSISSVADLVTAWGNNFLYYELDSETVIDISSSTHIPAEINVDDMGLTYFIDENGNVVDVKCYVDFGYYQSGKDQLFNAVTYQKQLAEVVATALCDVDSRIRAIENMESLTLTNLVVERNARINGWNKVDVQPSSSSSYGHPGDYYIATSKLYVCVSVNTWKSITIGSF